MRHLSRGARFASAAAALLTALQLGAMAALGGRSLQGAAHGGRQAEPERHLADAQHRQLGPPGTCGASRTGGRARCGRRRSGRARRRRGRRDSLPAGGGGAKEGELREPPDRRPGNQVLSARRAAGDLHALPVPNRADAERHPDGLRVCGRRPHDLHGQGAAEPGRQLDGTLGRPLGGGHAGGRRDEPERPDLVRPRRQFPQRRAACGRALHAARAPTR